MNHQAVDWDFALEITKRLCELGKGRRRRPALSQVEPFKHYFSNEGELKYDEVDERDGRFTRREILARYLLVNVVLDQGPDMVGVGDLLKNVTTSLYRREIRVFHRPIDFFKELGVSIDELLDKHESIKRIRAEGWAKENDSSASKYNLFFAQSMRGVISTKQVLDYAVHRWGVPLCVPLLLEKDAEKSGEESLQPLVDYLERYNSAEIMAQRLKDDERYGLGNAIGDKACHLFAKIYVSRLKLVKHRRTDKGWTGISYEVPFDSNAGRVLFRTGFLLEWATRQNYEGWDVIQRGVGKGGANYIRVTNLRGVRTPRISKDCDFFADYVELMTEYLRMGQRPHSVEIQRIPNLLIHRLRKEGCEYSVADFDDELMHIGTTCCWNHENPKCAGCHLKDLCVGYNKERDLIEEYRT